MREHHLDKVEFAKFTGTEHWHRHALNSEVLFRDGARYVADHAGAYWLLDEIALAQLRDKRIVPSLEAKSRHGSECRACL